MHGGLDATFKEKFGPLNYEDEFCSYSLLLQSLSEELQFSRQNSASLDEMSDLKRQVVLLQQQGEDKDRTIRQLQRQLEAANRNRGNNDSPAARSPPVNGNAAAAASNVATQTDRVRMRKKRNLFLPSEIHVFC